METAAERFCMYCELRPLFLEQHRELFNQIDQELNEFGLNFETKTGFVSKTPTEIRDQRAFEGKLYSEPDSYEDNIRQINEQLVLLLVLYKGDGLTVEIQNKCISLIENLQRPFHHLVRQKRDQKLKDILAKYEINCEIALASHTDKTRSVPNITSLEQVHDLFDFEDETL